MTGEIVTRSAKGVAVNIGVTGIRMAVGFGSQIVLARLLDPAVFGVFAFAWMVVSFLGTLTTIQSSKYLIQVEDEELDRVVSTTFSMEILLALAVLGISLLLLPGFYGTIGRSDEVALVLVLALTLIHHPIVQLRGLLERNLDFVRASIPDLVGIVANAVTAIAFAVGGFGAWSLVAGRLAQAFMASGVLLPLIPIRPSPAVDREVLGRVWSFSWPIAASAVLVYFYWNVDYYLVGTYLDPATLGLYWLAFQMTHHMLPVKDAVTRVLYPALCRMESGRQAQYAVRWLTTYTWILFSVPLFLLMTWGEPLIVLVFGSEWAEATPLFQVFAVVTLLRATVSYWDPVLTQLGHTRLLFSAASGNAIIVGGLGFALLKSGFGAITMALVVLTGVLLVAFFLGYQVFRLTGFNYFSAIGRPVSLFLLTVGGSLLVTRQSSDPTVQAAVSVLGLAAYIALVPVAIPEARVHARGAWDMLRALVSD